jgi:hypothetical protein
MQIVHVPFWILLLSPAVVFLSPHRSLAADAPDVGQVRFPVSANAPAQEKFNRAVAMLSFVLV